MKHAIVTFRLHRRGVILLAVGAVLLGALLFAAGCLTGMRRAGRTVSAGSAAPAVPKAPAPAAAQPARPAKSAEAPAEPEEAYALRVGSFADEAEAKTLADELTAGGHKPVIAPLETSGGVLLHTVRIGPYATREAASEAATGLARRGVSAVIVPAAP